MLGPEQSGHRLALAYYRRRCRAWDQVIPGVLIGRQLTDFEARQVVQQGVTAVLDLTAEFSEASPFLAISYYQLRLTPSTILLDYATSCREIGD